MAPRGGCGGLVINSLTERPFSRGNHSVCLAMSSSVVSRGSCHPAWAIAAAASLGLCFSAPGQSVCIGVVILPVMEAIGSSRTLITVLYLIGTLTSALILPRVGVLVDRYGPRICIVVVSLGLGLACMFMSTVSNAPMLLLGFFLLRFSGQGSMCLVSQCVINLWWVKKRGKIQGVAGSVASMAMSWIVPQIMLSSTAAWGWRVTYVALGSAVICVMGPVGALFYRSKPEDHGLLPDAEFPAEASTDFQPLDGAEVEMVITTSGPADDVDRKDEAGSDVPPALQEESWTVREALRTPAFWLLSLGNASVAATGTGQPCTGRGVLSLVCVTDLGPKGDPESFGQPCTQ